MAGEETTSDAFIREQSDALVLSLGRFVWPMHIVSAALLSPLLWPSAGGLAVGGWAIWMSVLAVAQGAIAFRGSHAGGAGIWPRAFDASAVLLAAGWGWLAFMLHPSGQASLQAFIGFVIGGAVLVGTGTHNLHYRMLIVTLLLILPPQALRLWLEGPDARGAAVAGMLGAFLVLMLALGWFLRSVTRRGFAVQWEKIELAHQLEVQAVDLQTARAAAEAANSAKSRFLAQASHDLRQPIHSMGLFLAALSSESLPRRTREMLDRIEQSVEALSKLFNALLDVTLLETGQSAPQPARFSLDGLLNDVADEFRLAAETSGVRIEVAGSGLNVRTDPLIVRRILQNLVSNALRHANCDLITLAALEEAHGVYVSVSDDGQGVAEADRDRIFEEFSQAGGNGGVDLEAGGGLGLGLFIVRRLGDALGVRVELRSSPGEGSRFVAGPFEAAATADPVEPPSANVFAELARGRVLVIDDDTAALDSTSALLAEWGWTVEARRSISASDAAALTAPALIISDHDLGPAGTGLEAIAAIRSVHGPVPALIVSGDTTETLRLRIEGAGLILLRKPVRPVQLRSAMLGVLG